MLAVAAVGIFENRQLALPVAAHDLESVVHRQLVECDLAELFDPRFGQVLTRLHIDEIALKQVVALLIGVEDFGAVDADFVHAGDRRFGNLVDLRELRNARREVLSDFGFAGQRIEAGEQGSPEAEDGKKFASEFHERTV